MNKENTDQDKAQTQETKKSDVFDEANYYEGNQSEIGGLYFDEDDSEGSEDHVKEK